MHNANRLTPSPAWPDNRFVPEKEGNGFGDLINTTRTGRAMRLFYVRSLSHVPMGGGSGDTFGYAGFPLCTGSPTPLFAAHPFGDGSGSNITQRSQP
ncbi:MULTISPECIES: hypothetical protein [unclassified Herbaspirillum]|uniref:hypothetical protein n=1 Tax=unclassified Herbaspirillum TaxID=2624150 RepID=UPI001617DCEE|nr:MULTISPECIES: hypothetical protein [unclassified Herbaspirillum]